MLTAIRSGLFQFFCFTWTGLLMLLYLPLMGRSRRHLQPLAAFWCRGLLALVRVFCGIRWRVVGSENLQPGPILIAAKHQSEWDGLIFHLLLKDPVYVLKRELIEIPMFGFYLARLGSISIDRSAGFRAIKQMLPAVRSRLSEGAQVIVFPEGTRVPPGECQPYHPGIAALYQRCDAPLIPVALNSGLFWTRHAFRRLPGTITIEFLPPIPHGLDREVFLTELTTRIETATDRLCGLAVPAGVSPPAPIPAPVERGENL
ncbi:MAG: lysophospholipid acyltransferase family protein [Rhodospirillales bacterium]